MQMYAYFKNYQILSKMTVLFCLCTGNRRVPVATQPWRYFIRVFYIKITCLAHTLNIVTLFICKLECLCVYILRYEYTGRMQVWDTATIIWFSSFHEEWFSSCLSISVTLTLLSSTPTPILAHTDSFELLLNWKNKVFWQCMQRVLPRSYLFNRMCLKL